MEYPFKDLLPRDEVLEREGYYKDWTHLDPEAFYSLTQISEYIKTKVFGVDVRLLIAQLAEHFSLKTTQINETERFFKDIMQELAEDKDFYSLPEIVGARRGYDTLAESLRNLSADMLNPNLGKLTQLHLSDELLAQIAGNTAVNAVPADGSLTTPKYANKSVTPTKMSNYKTGKNLLSKHADLTWIVGLLTQSGRIAPSGVTYNSTEDYIEVIPGGDYFLSFGRPDGRGDGGYSFYDINQAHISTHYISATFKDGLKITTPASARFIRFSIKNNTTWYQFEEGSTPTAYTDEYKLNDLYIGAEKEDIDNAINELKNVPTPFNHDAELVMFTAYGQSWAQGYDNDAYSTEQIYDNLMFNTGVRNNPLEKEVTPTSLVSLVEANGVHNWESPDYAQKVGETPVAGQTNMVKQLLSEENKATTTNVKYQFIGNSPGRGSLSIDGLSKGTVWYNRLIKQVQQAFDLSQAQGKTFKMLAFSWTQGGNEYVADYGTKLEKLRADIESEVKAITGQKEPVKCITWQPFSGMANGTAKRLYDEFVKPSETYEHIINAGATYQLDPLSKSNVHLTSQSSAHLGAYYGLAFKRVINDGVKFEPLKPTKVTTQRQIALLEFNNSTPLEFDTDTLVKADNYGFKILKSDGTEVPIQTVQMVSYNTIKIVRATGWWNPDDRIVYGDTGIGYGGTDRKRGNLRDSSDITYKYKDLNLPLYNWCVVFDKAVNEF